MKIRRAEGKDLPIIRKLIAAFPSKLLQDYLPPPSNFFLASLDGEIVGCCALQVYSRRLAEIRSLAVKKSQQGRGVATALISRCLEEARRKKVYEVISITGAIELFEKNGFKTFNEEKYAMLKIL